MKWERGKGSRETWAGRVRKNELWGRAGCCVSSEEIALNGFRAHP